MCVLDKRITLYILCNMKVATSIKLDKKVKQDAVKLAADLGLNLSSVINATLKQFVRNKGVSISVQSPAAVSPKREKELLMLLADAKAGNNMIGPFTSVDEVAKSLNIPN
jgi:addiction module RelB/DinJ family antitoxin